MDNIWELLWLILITVIFIGMYFLPTIIAAARKKTNVGGIAIVNILTGWSMIGWIVALVMACSVEQKPVVVVQQNGSDW